MNLNGKTFRAVGNSSHGTLNTETRMTFAEDAMDITAVYSGGTIRAGNVVAQRTGESAFDMLYHPAWRLTPRLRGLRGVSRRQPADGPSAVEA